MNSDSTTDYTLTHDAAGNLTDDGKDYAYVYDAWYRLRQIKNRTSGNVVSEHKYYGNGFRAGEHYDSDASGTVDSSDKWFWFAYDERWRILGTYRDADSSPKERFLHHSAGLGGYGGSSYIDDVVLRERDANTDWNGTAADGTLEERLYYCQNWRHDVVALVTSGGAIKERAKYFAYGIPFGIPLGDCDGDGDVDAADQSILLGAWGTSTVRCDLNLDGTVNASDQSIQSGEYGATSGWAKLSRCRNRLGYAGYVADMAVGADWHVRHRCLESKLGRWLRRDPSRYVDGCNLVELARSEPLVWTDPTGLFAIITYTPVPRNSLGICGQFECSAGVTVMNGPTPIPTKTDLVQIVSINIQVTCCDGVARGFNDARYERINTLPPLRPLQIWNAKAEHSLSSAARKCALDGTDARAASSSRLITHDDSQWISGSGHSVIPQLCGAWDWDGQTGPEQGDWYWELPDLASQTPAGWDTPYAMGINTHSSQIHFAGCCPWSPLPTAGGTCIPGAPFTWDGSDWLGNHGCKCKGW